MLIECVPNISEGKNLKIINSVIRAIKKVNNIKILDVFIGYDTNRTVITMIGNKLTIEDAAFACIKASSQYLDMSKQKGVHPRMGATDVCPFIPLENATMADCVDVANRLGKRVGNELGIPVYLYGFAALNKNSENLANVRKGEYEGLKEKFKSYKPDFGSIEYNDIVRKSGAVAIGARDFLIAFNINLKTKDVELAKKIAANIRESGCNTKKLKCVKGIGWYIDEYSCTQLSFNLTDYKLTPLYALYEASMEQARLFGTEVTGSELVGLIPKKALIDSGLYFCEIKHKNEKLNEKELIQLAVKEMRLDCLKPFNIEQKIIEYRSLNI